MRGFLRIGGGFYAAERAGNRRIPGQSGRHELEQRRAENLFVRRAIRMDVGRISRFRAAELETKVLL